VHLTALIKKGEQEGSLLSKKEKKNNHRSILIKQKGCHLVHSFFSRSFRYFQKGGIYVFTFGDFSEYRHVQ
jgi:hypothetical protein